MLLVADIAGEFNTLQKLLGQVPNLDLKNVCLLGDLVDRGKQSRQVIEWAIANNIQSVLGNHEHMMLDFHGRAFKGQEHPMYDRGLWEDYNGGQPTLNSYKGKVPKEHLDWLAGLPLVIDKDGLLISHSVWEQSQTLAQACNMERNNFYNIEVSIIWNREQPTPLEGKLQIFGHNSQWGLRHFKDAEEKVFAICLDDSRKKRLTAYDTETALIYQENYIR